MNNLKQTLALPLTVVSLLLTLAIAGTALADGISLLTGDNSTFTSGVGDWQNLRSDWGFSPAAHETADGNAALGALKGVTHDFGFPPFSYIRGESQSGCLDIDYTNWPGDTKSIRFSGYVKNVSTTSIKPYILFVNADNCVGAAAWEDGSEITASGWTFFSVTADMVDIGSSWNPEGIKVGFYLYGSAANQVSLADDLMLISWIPTAITLDKSVNPITAKPGEAITYTISFSNTGAVTATNVVITDTLSTHITNPSWSSSGVALTPIGGQTYAWTAPDLLQGDGGVITITGVLAKPLAAGTIPNTVTLAVSGTVQTANANLTVENVAPVANAGVDQTKSISDTVTLAGSGTDDNGDTLTYGWTQTGGSPTVSLSNPAARSPTFTAPSAATVLTFTLTVTDTGSLTGTDEVVVTVTEGYIYYFPIMFKNATVP